MKLRAGVCEPATTGSVTMTRLLRTESCVRITLALLLLAAALAGGCVDVKVDREAVRVSRLFETGHEEPAQAGDPQLPVALYDRSDEAR
jgi:hypothetical protein